MTRATASRQIEAGRKTLACDRYELHTALVDGSGARRYADTPTAEFERFCREHAADRNAVASIYDHRTRSYVASFRGGSLIGPVDKMHPMERMMRRARAAGQRVVVVSL